MMPRIIAGIPSSTKSQRHPAIPAHATLSRIQVEIGAPMMFETARAAMNRAMVRASSFSRNQNVI